MPEIEVNIEVNIELYCDTCGAGICSLATATKTRNRQEPCFLIKACETCMKKSRQEGYDDGYVDGKEEGRAC